MYELEKILKENGLESIATGMASIEFWKKEIERSDMKNKIEDEVDNFKHKIFGRSGHLKITNVLYFVKKHGIRGEELKTLRAAKKYMAFGYVNNGELGLLQKYDEYRRIKYVLEDEKNYLKIFGLTNEHKLKKMFNKETANEFLIEHIQETFKNRFEMLREQINIASLQRGLDEAIKADIEKIRNK